MERYYGKYQGAVVNNIDPLQIGRLQVQVPAVSGMNPANWAKACVPITGQQMGTFFLPAIGSSVWVEFEGGDPLLPIWTGGFWGSSSEVPSLALAGNPVSPSIVLQTGMQNTFTISDVPGPTGGILLKSASGAFISINEVGITISNGQGATITLNGPTVTINQGALAVT